MKQSLHRLGSWLPPTYKKNEQPVDRNLVPLGGTPVHHPNQKMYMVGPILAPLQCWHGDTIFAQCWKSTDLKLL
jgi:hypothetical protein